MRREVEERPPCSPSRPSSPPSRTARRASTAPTVRTRRRPMLRELESVTWRVTAASSFPSSSSVWRHTLASPSVFELLSITTKKRSEPCFGPVSARHSAAHDAPPRGSRNWCFQSKRRGPPALDAMGRVSGGRPSSSSLPTAEGGSRRTRSCASDSDRRASLVSVRSTTPTSKLSSRSPERAGELLRERSSSSVFSTSFRPIREH